MQFGFRLNLIFFRTLNKFYAKLMYANYQLIRICNSSQGLTPRGGIRCSLKILGHPIIVIKRLQKLPSTEMEKTATPDNYIYCPFADATLFCSLIVQKQEFIEMPQKLNESSSKQPKGRYAKLILSHVLKKTTVNRLHKVHKQSWPNVTATYNKNDLKHVKRRNSKIA